VPAPGLHLASVPITACSRRPCPHKLPQSACSAPNRPKWLLHTSNHNSRTPDSPTRCLHGLTGRTRIPVARHVGLSVIIYVQAPSLERCLKGVKKGRAAGRERESAAWLRQSGYGVWPAEMHSRHRARPTQVCIACRHGTGRPEPSPRECREVALQEAPCAARASMLQ
jgi:hypothetical protein